MEYTKLFNDIFFFGNSFWKIASAVLLITLGFALAKFLKIIFKRIAKKQHLNKNHIRDTTFTALSKTITFLLFSICTLISINILSFPDNIVSVIEIAASVLITISITHALYFLIEVPSVWFDRIITNSDSIETNKMFIPVARKTLRVVVIVFALIQIFQILSDKPITSILAGLGIGGLAVALAAQDTFRHFFGSFVLAGDKPFEIGERVVIDGHDGNVENIGLRSTKIRTLEGHEVSIPNGELSNKTIQNVGRRPYIRRLFNISITYSTPPEKIKKALEIVKNILKDHEGMEEEFPPKVYFNVSST